MTTLKLVFPAGRLGINVYIFQNGQIKTNHGRCHIVTSIEPPLLLPVYPSHKPINITNVQLQQKMDQGTVFEVILVLFGAMLTIDIPAPASGERTFAVLSDVQSRKRHCIRYSARSTSICRSAFPLSLLLVSVSRSFISMSLRSFCLFLITSRLLLIFNPSPSPSPSLIPSCFCILFSLFVCSVLPVIERS